MLPLAFLDEAIRQLPLLACGAEQRLAVIGKGKRNNPRSRQPAGDSARHDSVRQGFAGSRGGQDKGLIAVRSLQSFEPASPVERRSARVVRNQFIPARVGQWIDKSQGYRKAFRKNLDTG